MSMVSCWAGVMITSFPSPCIDGDRTSRGVRIPRIEKKRVSLSSPPLTEIGSVTGLATGAPVREGVVAAAQADADARDVRAVAARLVGVGLTAERSLGAVIRVFALIGTSVVFKLASPIVIVSTPLSPVTTSDVPL